MCTSPRQIVPDFHYKLDVLLWNPRYIFCTNLNENHFIFQPWFVGFFVNGNHVLHFNLCSVISIFNLFKLVMIYLCDNVLSWGGIITKLFQQSGLLIYKNGQKPTIFLVDYHILSQQMAINTNLVVRKWIFFLILNAFNQLNLTISNQNAYDRNSSNSVLILKKKLSSNSVIIVIVVSYWNICTEIYLKKLHIFTS